MSYAFKRRCGLLVCHFCDRTFATGADYAVMCSDCSASFVRARRTMLSGDPFDEMVWAARRARTFALRVNS